MSIDWSEIKTKFSYYVPPMMSSNALNVALEKYLKSDCASTSAIAAGIAEKKDDQYKILKIIHNDSAVIVFWKDKTKTVVKLKEDDCDDIYAAVAQALAKKVYGCNSAFHKMVDKVTEDHTTPMESVKASTVDGFKKFFDGVWNLSHPKGTDRHSGDED